MARCSRSSSLSWKVLFGVIPVYIPSIIAVMEMRFAYEAKLNGALLLEWLPGLDQDTVVATLCDWLDRM